MGEKLAEAAANQCLNKNIFSTDFARFPQYLPSEIWKLVSNNLLMPNPNDLENLQLSSPFFQNLLANERTNYLFGKVFPLVTSSIWNKEGLEGFPVSDVLKCRAVCANWNAVIDKWIPEEFHHSRELGVLGVKDNNILIVRIVFLSKLLKCGFTNSNNDNSVQQFLRHFEHTHPVNCRNPMIWKKFSVEITRDEGDEDESYQQFLEGISLVLSKYGVHFHSFSVENDRWDFFRNTSKLGEWLQCMPNLRVFKYWLNNFVDSLPTNEIVDPFPAFEKLDTLEIEGLPEAVSSQFICRNPKISKLSLSLCHPDHNIFQLHMPNLKNVELSFKTRESIEIVSSCQILWPVESLKLSYTRYRDDNLVGCTPLFQLVPEKFASTLVSLDLFLSLNNYNNKETCSQIWEDCKTCRFDLPKLKKIKIEMRNVIISLDFLLHMKDNLEEISVFVGYGSTVVPNITQTNGCIIQFVGFEGNMLDSNIWGIFEKLQNFVVIRPWKQETRQYSREEWMLTNEHAC